MKKFGFAAPALSTRALVARAEADAAHEAAETQWAVAGAAHRLAADLDPEASAGRRLAALALAEATGLVPRMASLTEALAAAQAYASAASAAYRVANEKANAAWAAARIIPGAIRPHIPAQMPDEACWSADGQTQCDRRSPGACDGCMFNPNCPPR